MIKAALFAIFLKMKKKWPLVREQGNILCYRQMMEYCTTVEVSELQLHTTWMNLSDITLSGGKKVSDINR